MVLFWKMVDHLSNDIIRECTLIYLREGGQGAEGIIHHL